MPDVTKLYASLTKEGYDLGSLDSFSKAMDDPNRRQKLYGSLEKDNFDVGSFDAFEEKLGYKKKDPSQPSQSISGAPSTVPSTQSATPETDDFGANDFHNMLGFAKSSYDVNVNGKTIPISTFDIPHSPVDPSTGQPFDARPLPARAKLIPTIQQQQQDFVNHVKNVMSDPATIGTQDRNDAETYLQNVEYKNAWRNNPATFSDASAAQMQTYAKMYGVTLPAQVDGSYLAAAKQLKDKVNEDARKRNTVTRIQGKSEIEYQDFDASGYRNDQANNDVNNLYGRLAAKLAPRAVNTSNSVVEEADQRPVAEKFLDYITPSTFGSIPNMQKIAQYVDTHESKKLDENFFTGLNHEKLVDDVSYKRISAQIANNLPVSSSDYYRLTNMGLTIKSSDQLEELASGKQDINGFLSKQKDIVGKSTDLLLNQKDVLKSAFSNEIGDILDQKRTNEGDPNVTLPLHTIFGAYKFSDKEIDDASQVAAKNLGVDVNDARVAQAINSIKSDEGWMVGMNGVKKGGLVRELFKGAAQPIRGTVATIEDIARDDNTIYNENQNQYLATTTEQRPAAVVNNTVLNTLSDAFFGLVQFATQAGMAYAGGEVLGGAAKLIGAVPAVETAEAVSAAKTGLSGMDASAAGIGEDVFAGGSKIGNALLHSREAVSTMATSYLQTYDSYLKNAMTMTDDNSKARWVGRAMATLEGVTELILPDVELGKDIVHSFQKDAMHGLLSLSEKDLLKGGAKDGIKEIAGYVTSKLGKAVKTIGAEITEEEISQIGNFVANTMVNPQQASQRDLPNELYDTAISTAVSMAIPSFLHGHSANITSKDMAKSALYLGAKSITTAQDYINTAVIKGTMTTEDASAKIQALNTAYNHIQEIPNDNEGNKLSVNKATDYLYSRVRESTLEDAMKKTTDEVLKKRYASEIQKEQGNREALLIPAPADAQRPIQPAPAPVQQPTDGEINLTENSDLVLPSGEKATVSSIGDDGIKVSFQDGEKPIVYKDYDAFKKGFVGSFYDSEADFKKMNPHAVDGSAIAANPQNSSSSAIDKINEARAQDLNDIDNKIAALDVNSHDYRGVLASLNKEKAGVNSFYDEQQKNSFDSIKTDAPSEKTTGVQQYVDQVSPVLKTLFPNIKIQTHDTESGYRETTGRGEGSAAVYQGDTNTIHLNNERIEKFGVAQNTVYHEAMHPVVESVYKNDEGELDGAVSQINKLVNEKGFDELAAHVHQYSDRSSVEQKIEYVTEFLAKTLDGTIDYSKLGKSSFTKIKEFINKLFEKLGIERRISTANDIVVLADNIKKAMAGNINELKNNIGEKSLSSKGSFDSLRNKKDDDPNGEKQLRDELTQELIHDMGDLKDYPKHFREVAEWLYSKVGKISSPLFAMTTKERWDSAVKMAYPNGIKETVHGFYFERNKFGEMIIAVNPSLSAYDRAETTLHELVHAYTVQALKNPKSEIEKQYSEKMNKLYEYAKNNLSEEENGKYRMSNVKEFVAYALTNSGFQEKLKGIKDKSEKISLWQKFVGYVKTLFGKNATDSLLDSVLNNTAHFIEYNDYSGYRDKIMAQQNNGNAINNESDGAVSEKPVREENESSYEYAKRVNDWYNQNRTASEKTEKQKRQAAIDSREERNYLGFLKKGESILRKDISIGRESFNEQMGLPKDDFESYVATLQSLIENKENRSKNRTAKIALDALRKAEPKKVVITETKLLKKQWDAYKSGQIKGLAIASKNAAAAFSELRTAEKEKEAVKLASLKANAEGLKEQIKSAKEDGKRKILEQKYQTVFDNIAIAEKNQQKLDAANRKYRQAEVEHSLAIEAIKERQQYFRDKITDLFDTVKKEKILSGAKFSESDFLRIAKSLNRNINEHTFNDMLLVVSKMQDKADYVKKASEVLDMRKALQKIVKSGIVTGNDINVIRELSQLSPTQVSDLDRLHQTYVQLLSNRGGEIKNLLPSFADISRSSDFNNEGIKAFIAKEHAIDLENRSGYAKSDYQDILSSPEYKNLEALKLVRGFDESKVNDITERILKTPDTEQNYKEKVAELNKVSDSIRYIQSEVQDAASDERRDAEKEGDVVDFDSLLEKAMKDTDGKSEKNSSRNALVAQSAAAQAVVDLNDPSLSANQRAMLKTMKDVYVNNFDKKTLRLFNNLMQNIYDNDDNIGFNIIKAKYEAQQGEEAQKWYDAIYGQGYTVRDASYKPFRLFGNKFSWIEVNSSFDNFMARISNNSSTVRNRLLGITHYGKIRDNASKVKNDIHNELSVPLANILRANKIKIDDEMNARLTYYSWLMQNKNGTLAENAAELKRRMGELLNDIQVKEKAGKAEQSESTIIRKIFYEMVGKINEHAGVELISQNEKGQDVINPAEVAKITTSDIQKAGLLTKGESEIYDLYRSLYDKYRPQFVDAVRSNQNKEVDLWNNYMKDSFRGLKGAFIASNFTNPAESAFSASANALNMTSDSSLDRVKGNRITALDEENPLIDEKGNRKSRGIYMNFLNSQEKNLSSMLMDIHTLFDRTVAQEVYDDSDFVKSIGGIDNTDLAKEFMTRELRSLMGLSDQRQDKAGAIVNAVVRGFSNIAAAKQLAGLGAYVKQATGQLASVITDLTVKGHGSYPFLAFSEIKNNQDVKDLLSKSLISQRGELKGGINIYGDKNLGDLNDRLNSKSAFTKAKDKVLVAIGKKDEYTGEVHAWASHFLTAGDVLGAEASWVAYYAHNLVQNGKYDDFKGIDWAKENAEPNLDASAYAQDAVSNLQNVNSRASASEFVSSGHATAARAIFGAFGSFGMNKFEVYNQSLKTILNSGGDQPVSELQRSEELKEAWGRLASSVVEDAFFGILIKGGFWLSKEALGDFLYGLVGSEDEEAKKRKKSGSKKMSVREKAVQLAWGTLANTAFSGATSQGQEFLQKASNAMLKMFGADPVFYESKETNLGVITAATDNLQDDLLRMYQTSINHAGLASNKDRAIALVSMLSNVAQMMDMNDADLNRVMHKVAQRYDEAILKGELNLDDNLETKDMKKIKIGQDKYSLNSDEKDYYDKMVDEFLEKKTEAQRAQDKWQAAARAYARGKVSTTYGKKIQEENSDE